MKIEQSATFLVEIIKISEIMAKWEFEKGRWLQKEPAPDELMGVIYEYERREGEGGERESEELMEEKMDIVTASDKGGGCHMQ